MRSDELGDKAVMRTMRVWQPIENAPKDRLIWLADWSGGFIELGCWMVINGLAGFYSRSGQPIDDVEEWCELSEVIPPSDYRARLETIVRDTAFHENANEQFSRQLGDQSQ